MSLWNKFGQGATTAPRLDDRFTTEEVECLTNLRRRIARQPVHLDLGIEVCRLEFARWLVEQGRLNEGLTPNPPFDRWAVPAS